ncbi:MAG: SAM-dependent methyltransferase [Bacteroidales bacterium]
METHTARLFLLPSNIGEGDPFTVLPANYPEVVCGIRIFFVEEIRTARRFLRKIGFTTSFDEVFFIEINEHTFDTPIENLVAPIAWQGQTLGLLSEAGVPCVADPGAFVVAWAHRQHIQVCPLVGPSSILLALMASGFNGQHFLFHGYLPVDKTERNKKIKEVETQSRRLDQTQIFIETPYRNQNLFSAICEICQDETKLCIAKNITQSNEVIRSLSIKEWKKQKIDLHKQNTVFLLYA